MRELEFLPEWYPRLQGRRRLLALQGYMTLAGVGVLVLWLFLVDRNQRSYVDVLDNIKGQVAQTSSQLQQMDRLEVLRKQWRQQVEVLNKLGTHIEASRLLGKITSSLPQNVYLMELKLETREVAVPLSNVAKASVKDPANPPVDRKLEVTMQGVAPTDVELATLLTELNKIPFFESIAPKYVRDRRESGHILREFELSFAINLNATGGF